MNGHAFPPTTAAWQTDRAKQLEIDTFADLSVERDRVADWLEVARLDLAWSLVRPDRPTARYIGDDERGSHFTEGTLVTVVARGYRGAYPTVEFGVDSWFKRLSDFRSGRLQTLRIEVAETLATDFSRGLLGWVSVDLFGQDDPHVANQLQVAVMDRAGSAGPKQAAWSSLADAAAREFHAATGFVAIDSQNPWSTAHEDDVGREGIREGLRDCRELVRGYAWATYLSQRHVQTLGGVRSVLSAAPVFAVRDVSADGHQLLCLQLTESFDDHSDDDLRRLKAYLAPILPTKTNPRWEYHQRPPRRIV